MMQEIFFKSDPSSVYSKVSEIPTLSGFMQEMSVESLEENLSFVAKENEKERKIFGKVNEFV